MKRVRKLTPEQREASRAYHRQHYILNREKRLAYQYAEHRSRLGLAKELFRAMRARARLRKRQCDIGQSEFLAWINSDDGYLKTFTEWEASGFESMLAPSIDRKDNRLGYLLENLQVLTRRDNLQKYWDTDRHMTPEQYAELRHEA